ncbi:MAG: bifunctional oligoribonuclease/PAP phosphatase NrnA [Gaiellales bacterium]
MTQTQTTELDAAVAVLLEGDRFAVTTHENPDGDAYGSLLALHLALQALGKDSVMVVGDQPIPIEYRLLDLSRHGLLTAPPEDIASRTLIAVDCAQESRISAKGLSELTPVALNVDHHHDNTRFGAVDLVVGDASSCGEVLADVFAAAGVELTPEIALALYVALVTDTGRFQYGNTTPKSLRLAATLVEAGAPLGEIFRSVYESVEFPRLKLLGKALESATLHDGNRVVFAVLTRADFASVGASEPDSEGVIDTLRSVVGTELACLVRELPPGGEMRCKGSLRASTSELDVSAIARLFKGGGHRQAAGFSSELDLEGVRETVLAAYREARGV